MAFLSVRFMRSAIVVAVAGTALFLGPGNADGTAQEGATVVTFNALAQHVGTGPGGQTQVIIQVTRWNTPDERDALQRSWDFNVSLIELTVDDEGNGEGILAAGVEFAYDQSNDSLTLKSLSSQPIRLNNVRATFQ